MSGVAVTSKMAVSAWMRRRKGSWSSSGTPRSSPITFTGSGKATKDIRSPPPLAARVSRRSSTNASMEGRRASTVRGVKAFTTTLRKRRCSGPSRFNIDRSPPASEGRSRQSGNRISMEGTYPRTRRGSRNTAWQSPYLLSSQPLAMALQCTGERARSAW